jgi:hypothetical protein
MDPEIECFDPATGKSEGFGELKGGLVVDCSLQLCRQYVAVPILEGKAYVQIDQFEIPTSSYTSSTYRIRDLYRSEWEGMVQDDFDIRGDRLQADLGEGGCW